MVRVPGSHLVGELARYDDELFAYLMFDYLRSRQAFRTADALLTYAFNNGTITYSVRVVLPNDFIGGIPQLYELVSQFPFYARLVCHRRPCAS